LPKGPSFHALDRVDCSIVRALQKNGRDSFAEIGKTEPASTHIVTLVVLSTSFDAVPIAVGSTGNDRSRE
jgi:hypothetical protein